MAREHVLGHHELGSTIDTLLGFLETAHAGRAGALRAIEGARLPEGSLLEYLHEELSFGAYDLGLGGFELGTDALLAELGEKPR